MKNIIKIAAIGITALGIANSAWALGPTLSISPTTTGTLNVSNNDTVTLTLNISGLQGNPDGTGPAVSVFELVLDYNPAVLSLVSDSFGSAVNSTNGMWVDPGNANNADTQVDLSSPGQIDLLDISGDSSAALLAGQASAFELGTVTFQAIGAGSTQVAWDASTSLSDQTGAGDVAFTNAQSGVTVNTVVPEPSTYAMFGLGIVLVVLARGRRFLRAA